jgi:hypothetical protein
MPNGKCQVVGLALATLLGRGEDEGFVDVWPRWSRLSHSMRASKVTPRFLAVIGELEVVAVGRVIVLGLESPQPRWPGSLLGRSMIC